MHLRYFFSLLFCAMITLAAEAQKQFELDQLIGGGERYWQLVPEYMMTGWWGEIPVKTTPDEVIDLNTGKTIVTVQQLNRLMGEELAFSGHSFSFPYAGETVVYFTKGARHLLVDFTSGQRLLDVTLPQGAAHVDFNSKSKQIAYTIEGNLYVLSAEGEELKVSSDGSTDGSEDIVYGQSVHRDEFGIHKGTFWAPDGKHLAFYRMDQSMVPSYPQVDIHPEKDYVGPNGSRIATTTTCHYPMAGEKSHHGLSYSERRTTIILTFRGRPTPRLSMSLSSIEIRTTCDSCRTMLRRARWGARFWRRGTRSMSSPKIRFTSCHGMPLRR